MPWDEDSPVAGVGDPVDLVTQGWPAGLEGVITCQVVSDDDGTILRTELTTGIVARPAGTGRYVLPGYVFPGTGTYSHIWRNPAEPERIASEQILVRPAPDVTGDMFLTADELVAWLNLPGEDAAAAELAVKVATSMIQDVLSPYATLTRRLIRVWDDVITLDGSGSPGFLLPDWPVVEVSQIVEDGVIVDPTLYEWSAANGRVRKVNAVPGLSPASMWTGKLRGLEVTYSHGFDPLPADVVGICRSVAARILAEPDGREIRSESIGSYAVSFLGRSPVGFTLLESAVLNGYRGER